MLACHLYFLFFPVFSWVYDMHFKWSPLLNTLHDLIQYFITWVSQVLPLSLMTLPQFTALIHIITQYIAFITLASYILNKINKKEKIIFYLHLFPDTLSFFMWSKFLICVIFLNYFLFSLATEFQVFLVLFYFEHIKVSLYSPLACMISEDKFDVILILIP